MMTDLLAKADTRRIRMALARAAYAADKVRLVNCQLTGHHWLVATQNGLFAVGPDRVTLVMTGWLFGMCRTDDSIFVFDNCALRNRTQALGRIICLKIVEGQIRHAVILAKGLDAHCHQLVMIDGILCLVDTAHQVIRRFALDGTYLGEKQPLPVAYPGDCSGAYLHINSLAKVNGRLALLLHNGATVPEKPSEIAWLADDWELAEREALEGQHCHDIAVDSDGMRWHCASATGELIAADGRRVKLSQDRMTRGLAFGDDAIAVGLSSFGPRQNRDALPGALMIMRPDFTPIATFELPGPPTVVIALDRVRSAGMSSRQSEGAI
jgi:hypothetical protein